MSEAGRNRRGMILAAGYGTRLSPLTDHVPKPLLPVGGSTLLDLAVANLDAAGVGALAVNTHHLGHQVAAHLAARPDAARFAIFPEHEILGTGGALHGARSFLGGAAHFLLHNGDVLTDADLGALMDAHESSGALATLLVVNWPAVNTVEVAEDGAVLRLAGRPAAFGGASTARRLTYAGIGAFAARVLDDVPPGPSSLVDVLARALEREPGCVRAWAPGNFRWSDVGTFARWLEVQPDGDKVGRSTDPVRLQRIRGHGSDRRFWRLSAADWSAVAMVGVPDDPEHERFRTLAAWLARMELGPAAVLRDDPDDLTVLMEDLGECSLYTLAGEAAADEPVAVRAWEMAVDRIGGIQCATAAAQADCPQIFDRALDHDALRWETDYFRDRFLSGLMALDRASLDALDSGFEDLARVVAAQPLYLIHRDYQSQNLLVKDGRLRLVDFQGMRPGPLGYDVASLLWDPYVGLGGARRERLLGRYAESVASGLGLNLEPLEVRAMVLASALQRLMQALGAYGFLSVVKGRLGFLGHVSRGLEHLNQVMALVDRVRQEGGAPAAWVPAAMPALSAVLDSLDPQTVEDRLNRGAWNSQNRNHGKASDA